MTKKRGNNAIKYIVFVLVTGCVRGMGTYVPCEKREGKNNNMTTATNKTAGSEAAIGPLETEVTPPRRKCW